MTQKANSLLNSRSAALFIVPILTGLCFEMSLLKKRFKDAPQVNKRSDADSIRMEAYSCAEFAALVAFQFLVKRLVQAAECEVSGGWALPYFTDLVVLL